jgi:hypothetical protein
MWRTASAAVGEAVAARMPWNLRRIWSQQAAFSDPASFEERMKSRVGIGLEDSLKALEMGLRMFSAPVGREGEQYRRRNRIGIEQSGRSADPSCKDGAIEVDALVGIDFRLPVHWSVIAVLGHQHMSEQPGAGMRSRDGTRRIRYFSHRLAAAAVERLPETSTFEPLLK